MELRVFLAGRVAMEVGNRLLADERFPGRQGRLLFAYLVIEQGRPVPRDELAEALWRDLPPPTWEKALGVLVSKLRSLLEECGIDGGRALTGAFGCYRLDLPEGTWIDVGAATSAADEAESALLAGEPSKARTAATEAVSLAQHAFVPGADGEWVERQRRELADVRARAVGSLTEACLRLGDAAAAVRWAEQAVAAEPFRETGYRQLMKAQVVAGNRAEALRVYERCRRLLAEELGADPSPETESIYRELLGGSGGVAVAERRTAVIHERELPPSAGTTAKPRRRRLLLAIGAGAALLAAGAAAVAVIGVTSSHGGAARLAVANSVGVIDPETKRLVADVPVGDGPTRIAYRDGALWVVEADDQTISRIDLATHTVRQTVQVGNGPGAVAVGKDAVWVANGLDGTVSRIDADTNRVVQTIDVGNGPSGIAVGNDSVWVVNRYDATVTKLDSETGKVLGTFEAGPDPTDVAVGFGAVWVTNGLSGEVVEINPMTNRVMERVAVGRGPGAIATGAGAVWVANSLDGTVSRIDPGKSAVLHTIPVRGTPVGLAVGFDSVWVTDELDRSVSRIDPARDVLIPRIPIRGTPSGVAASSDRLFVAVRPGAGGHRGGTLHVDLAVGTPIDSIDPGVSSDAVTAGVLSLVYDGLTTMRRVGGNDGLQLVPDLALSIPKPSNGGRTLTFRLRPGIRYSTGELVRPADFRRALERLFDLHSPDTYFFTAVRGAAACLRRPGRCDLSPGIVADMTNRTVTFQLTRPDPELPYKVALSDAFAIPRSTPSKPAGVRPLPGTGAYSIAGYVPGRRLTLVRNPRFHEWSHAARPSGNPDRIVIELGSFRPSQLRAVTRGRIDYLYADPRFVVPAELHHAGLLHSVARLGVWYVFLNTRLPPFDDLRVRRALSLSLDRDAIVRLEGGRLSAQTACQVLPPSFPGYVRNCSAEPRLAEAKRLVDASGTRGMNVVVWSITPTAGYMRKIVATLDSLGYRARLKIVDGPWNFRAIQAGPWSWFADYAAAGNFAALFSCGSKPDLNPAQFCDRRLERKIDRALALEASDPRSANELWAKIDRSVTERAPYVALLNTRRVDLVSPRVGNYQFNPVWGPLFDQFWVR